MVIALALAALAGCGGGSALKGTLEWQGAPERYFDHTRASNGVMGTLRNTTSHDVALDPKAMRLLDADGKKVRAKILLGRSGKTSLKAGGAAQLAATWQSGDPVRLDYGGGTLQLPPG
jgi:hypothetical protein